jgi:hypothetical protein
MPTTSSDFRLEKVIQEYQQEMIAYAFRKVDRPGARLAAGT